MYEVFDPGHGLILAPRAPVSVPGRVLLENWSPSGMELITLHLTCRVVHTHYLCSLPEAKTNERQHQELAGVLELSWGPQDLAKELG